MTTIAISEETKDRLKDTFRRVTKKPHGRFTMDEVLNRVLDEVETVYSSKSNKDYLLKTVIHDVEEVLNEYKNTV